MSNATQTIQNIPVDPPMQAIFLPVHQISVFRREAPGASKGCGYASNPAQAVLETRAGAFAKPIPSSKKIHTA